MVKLAAALLDLRDICNRDPEELFRQQKIGQGLLVVRVDFQENDMRGIVMSDDGSTKQADVRFAISCGKKCRPVPRQAVRALVSIRQKWLVGVQRGEAL